MQYTKTQSKSNALNKGLFNFWKAQIKIGNCEFNDKFDNHSMVNNITIIHKNTFLYK